MFYTRVVFKYVYEAEDHKLYDLIYRDSERATRGRWRAEQHCPRWGGRKAATTQRQDEAATGGWSF